MNECRTGLETYYVLYNNLWLTSEIFTGINSTKLNSDQGTVDFREKQASVTHALSRLSPWTPVSMVTILRVYQEDKVMDLTVCVCVCTCGLEGSECKLARVSKSIIMCLHVCVSFSMFIN